MKKSLSIFLLLFLGIFLIGCGKNDAKTSQEYQDIIVKREDFPHFEEDFAEDGENHLLKYLGTQFLGEEPIQLWAERHAAEDGSSSIYKWGLDGKRELLAEGISDHFTIGGYEWYLDRDGCFYLVNSSDDDNLLRKLDSQGQELFRIDRTDSFPWQIQDICQNPDRQVYLMLYGANGFALAELDPGTGRVAVLDKIKVDPAGQFGASSYLGAGVKGPAVCRDLDMREADIGTGELTDVLLFSETSYSVWGSGSYGYLEEVSDFRVTEKGSAEILKTNSYGSPAYIERLSLETVQRIPVVLCAPVVSDWLKRQIVRFNQENSVYHVIAEELGRSDGTGEAEYADAMEDFIRNIGIQLATGKGPDILFGEKVLGGNVIDMIEKGILEDLKPYMESTGVREEDYFPLAFSAWRRGEEIYGICFETMMEVQEGDRDVIGADIGETLENLLEIPDKRVFMSGVDSQELLRIFLKGSETLWGMVDWETGTCDFEGDLWKEILEVTKKYGAAPENQYPSVAKKEYYQTFYHASSPSELEKRGLRLAGWMFDDGIYGTDKFGEIMAINSHSAQKEGAWEFLGFLLKEEAQKDCFDIPLRRETFKEWINEQLERSSEERHVYIEGENRITGEWEEIETYGKEDREFLETEKIPYFEKMLEEARHFPIRPVPVIDIICEEAEQYFNGSKSVEEVVSVIENRVNLYLNERK